MTDQIAVGNRSSVISYNVVIIANQRSRLFGLRIETANQHVIDSHGLIVLTPLITDPTSAPQISRLVIPLMRYIHHRFWSSALKVHPKNVIDHVGEARALCIAEFHHALFPHWVDVDRPPNRVSLLPWLRQAQFAFPPP
jgi:hypothetical protein